VVFDPDECLEGGVLRAFGLRDEKYAPIDPKRFGELGLGLTLWEGEVEGGEDTWLRWIDADGKLIPNAKERAQAEMKRANVAVERVKRLEEKLRAAGLSTNGAP
jgi:hypothetical protein